MNLVWFAIFVYAVIRGEQSRKEYELLMERRKAVITIQKELRSMTARRKFLTTRKMVILVQAGKIQCLQSFKTLLAIMTVKRGAHTYILDCS